MFSSIRSFITSAFSSLGNITASLAYHFKRQLPGFGVPTFPDLANSILTDPHGSRSLELIVETMSSVHLQVKVRTGDEVEVTDEHPVLDLLRRPHPRMTYNNFIRAYTMGMYAGGEVFLQAIAPDTGANAGIPRRLRIHQTTKFAGFVGRAMRGASPSDVEGYKITTGGKTDAFTLDEVHHIFRYNPIDEFHGVPKLLSGWRDLRKQQAADSWNIGLSEGGGRISGIWKPIGLEPGEMIPSDKHDAVKLQLREEERRVRQSGESLVLSGSYDFEKASATPTDADLIDMQKMAGKNIAIAMGVDPALIGDSGSRTLANLEQALRGLYMLTVLPELDNMIEELNAWLMPKYGPDVTLTYDRDAIDVLQEDMTDKYERYVNAHGGPILTLEEAREAVGYSSEPEGTMFMPTMQAGGDGQATDSQSAGEQPTDDDQVRYDMRNMQALDDLIHGGANVQMRAGWGDGQ